MLNLLLLDESQMLNFSFYDQRISKARIDRSRLLGLAEKIAELSPQDHLTLDRYAS